MVLYLLHVTKCLDDSFEYDKFKIACSKEKFEGGTIDIINNTTSKDPSIYRGCCRIMKGEISLEKVRTSLMNEEDKTREDNAMKAAVQNKSEVPVGTKTLKAKRVKEKMKTKGDFYKFFKEEADLFLPNFLSCPGSFLTQLLRGDKLGIKRTNVKHCALPKYKEFSMENLKSLWFLPMASFCLPDTKFTEFKDKSFLVDVCNTLYESIFKTMLDKLRILKTNEKIINVSGIQITKEYAELLKNSTIIPTGSNSRSLVNLMTNKHMDKPKKKRKSTTVHVISTKISKEEGEDFLTSENKKKKDA